MTERIKAYICVLFDKYGGACCNLKGCGTLFLPKNQKKIKITSVLLKKVLYLQSQKTNVEPLNLELW